MKAKGAAASALPVYPAPATSSLPAATVLEDFSARDWSSTGAVMEAVQRELQPYVNWAGCGKTSAEIAERLYAGLERYVPTETRIEFFEGFWRSLSEYFKLGFEKGAELSAPVFGRAEFWRQVHQKRDEMVLDVYHRVMIKIVSSMNDDAVTRVHRPRYTP